MVRVNAQIPIPDNLNIIYIPKSVLKHKKELELLLHPTVSDLVFLTLNSALSVEEQVTENADLTHFVKYMYDPRKKHDNNAIVLTNIEKLDNLRQGMESAFEQIKDLIIGEVEKPNILGYSYNEKLKKKSMEHFESCIEKKFESIAKKDSSTTI